MRFDILTLFPEFFPGPLSVGVVARAFRSERAEVHTHNLRDFTHDRHRTVDDRPFGGGEGMVLKPGPIFECIDSLGFTPKAVRDLTRERVILLSAQGRPFTQSSARELAGTERIALICGRYEGVDERVAQLVCDTELSIGDYVLSGGELAAAVVVDAVGRLLPGVLGHVDSSRYESFGEGDNPDEIKTLEGVPRATHGAGGLLDYPQYTRPATFRGAAVPAPLASGDHLEVRRWRRLAALAKTRAHRPDLLAAALLSDGDRKLLRSLEEESGEPQDDVNVGQRS